MLLLKVEKERRLMAEFDVLYVEEELQPKFEGDHTFE